MVRATIRRGKPNLHGEIYKARPDVKAVLYARPPEVVAFTTGPLTLRPIVNGGGFLANGLPLVASPATGSAVVEALAKRAGVLLAGDGFVLTAGSIYDLVNRAYQLRMNAKIQQQAIALRAKVTYLEPLPGSPPPSNEPAAPARQLGPPEGRWWVYWSQNVTLEE